MNLPPEPRSPWVTIALRLLIIGIYAYCALVLLASLDPRIELAVHFVMHALLGTLLIEFLLYRLLDWKERLTLVPPMLFLLVLFEPWALWIPGGSSPTLGAEGREPQRLAVTSWNMLYSNLDFDEARKVIEKHPADILVLIEVGPEQFRAMPFLSEIYPHGTVKPAWSGTGMAVISHREDLQFEPMIFGDDQLPAIVVTVPDKAGQPALKVVAMHTASPLPAVRAIRRDLQLDEFRKWAEQQTVPVCLIGDLNTTPWSRSFHDLERAGFIDSRQLGFGNCASWPANLGVFGIPIDHVLVRGPIRILKRTVGPITRGSDHQPIAVELEY